ncbi:hypothetical protein AV274_5009 [Blastocystis sp. ATCC 50177/Nand II]|uniref:Transmembrane protein n=1 Tax=Blastocystis sp. subtype 1 (strain ATCC 50177 / NandII) TaxID=478820 RepID=A0A196SBE9_BLAHN|nr:hypothetical protein AV274_5009 [Blastocystis sp. ATCC 50177/Nand II]
MDSYRKRQHNAHIKEELIDKTQKEETMEPKEKDDVSISESGKRRVDSIVDEIAEENSIDIHLEEYSKRKRKCMGGNEKWRYLVISACTLLFSLIAMAFGIFLLIHPIHGVKYIRSGIIALCIGIICASVPVC